MASYPAQFPNGAIVDRTGRMVPGNDGRYFFLALYNRTGGGAGAPAGTPATGLTVSGLHNRATTRATSVDLDGAGQPRTIEKGLTIGMLKARGLA